jgi:hypothetical protein
MFEPLSKPSRDYLRLPVDVIIDEIIADEQNINRLEVLVGQPSIAFEFKQRTKVSPDQETRGISILTLSGENEVIGIDFLQLAKSKKLDKLLTSIFSNEKTTMVTF